MGEDLTTFTPIFVYLGIVLAFAVVALSMAHLVGPRKTSKVKQMTYESGMDPIGDARQPMDFGFFLLAVLFLVFDVELLFLYPWAVAAYQPGGGIPLELRSNVFAVMIFFIATLVIAYAYAWRKGVFRWR